MKNIFKFIPPEDNNYFKIEEPQLQMALKHDKHGFVDSSLSNNLDAMKEFFHFPLSNDFKLRTFDISVNGEKYNAAICFYDGLVDSNSLNNAILKPLMNEICTTSKSVLKKPSCDTLKNAILGAMLIQSNLNIVSEYSKVIDSINHGDCALFVDSLNIAIICDAKKIPARSVGKSENEMTIKGPSEGFIETLRVNTALIRKFVKDENLIFESIEIGTKSKTKCTIAYISDITNDSIINEVKRRI